ncbi:hypothetical protein CCY99_00965 [Helicobacter sp. 16-1353]|uniref:autotransporter outer membrane beta-barrel domain-containing protein n=1 Tax=Helicobacter sp. 16-1353 TaxID=2004996 RepID=UPI000DCC1D17|nr:autotransporter outer membrane beta-barrel domain-containing protein [Helicobacter sp. 16-1353]RAX55302.1 hypothetical protein CCY99_00965 [Helicobacter sp. 16-1353]
MNYHLDRIDYGKEIQGFREESLIRFSNSNASYDLDSTRFLKPMKFFLIVLLITPFVFNPLRSRARDITANDTRIQNAENEVNVKTSTIKNLTNESTITNLKVNENGKVEYLDNYGTINNLTNDRDGTIEQLDNNEKSKITNLTNNKKAQIHYIDNYKEGTITNLKNNGTIQYLDNYGTINNLTNNGTIEYLDNYNGGVIDILNNYGKINSLKNSTTITNLNNTGEIRLHNINNDNDISDIKKIYAHINNITENATINISAYHLVIDKKASDFNSFSGYNAESYDLSHLVIQDTSSNKKGVKLKDTNSKILLTLGKSFELNTKYSLAKLITNTDGNQYKLTYENNGDINLNTLFSHLKIVDSTALGYDASFLTLVLDGESFRVNILSSTNQMITNSIQNTKNKANVTNINNIALNLKSNVFKNLGGSGLALSKRDEILQELESLKIAKIRQSLAKSSESNFKENDRFYYNNTQDSIILDSNLNSNDSHNYHTFFTPFITHSILDGDISGLSYGFVGGFNAKLADSHTLGTHIGFNYGSMNGNKSTNNIDINNLNILLGLHYKLDLVYGMYVKALVDFIYINNDGKYSFDLGLYKVNSNSYGYNANIAFGKDFSLKNAGILGIEIGFNPLGIKTNDTQIGTHKYIGDFTNLLYGDLGLNYNIRFKNGFGLDSMLGVKYLFNNPQGKMALLNTIINYDIGVDKLISYIGFGVNYSVNSSITLGLNYLGNFGDRTITNSGFLNIKIGW